MRVHLRLDAFNAVNHPQFGNVSTNPSSSFFGALGESSTPSQVNAPRAIQLGINFYLVSHSPARLHSRLSGAL